LLAILINLPLVIQLYISGTPEEVNVIFALKIMAELDNNAKG
jgi:hypothetical protein